MGPEEPKVLDEILGFCCTICGFMQGNRDHATRKPTTKEILTTAAFCAVALLLLGAGATLGPSLFSGCEGPSDVEPVAIPTDLTLDFTIEWGYDDGTPFYFEQMAVWGGLDPKPTSWALYAYEAEWRVTQSNDVLFAGLVDTPGMEPIEGDETPPMGPSFGPYTYTVPLVGWAGDGELQVRSCWHPDVVGWPTLCAPRNYYYSGDADLAGWIWLRSVSAVDRVYLPAVMMNYGAD